jgi:hypothetical protein
MKLKKIKIKKERDITRKSESEKGVSFIFAARERQDITRSLSTHGFPCCISKKTNLFSVMGLDNLNN